MIIGGLYEVTGGRGYRGHTSGAVFEAVLDPLAESRALGRGDIRRIKRISPSIQPGTFTLPRGWLNQQEEDRND